MFLGTANAMVNPITIQGRHFVDSVTGKPFFVQGVDYQPGGSSAYTRRSDPLSDEDICRRDIFLFQHLGINTVRVYTVNPRLNHDACMTMLAAAGIYLLLDLNSPLVGESIHRYEPWTTYNPDYLHHVFEVAEQFSRYNNTLGFFVANEVVNDEKSAAVSPGYIRAVTRDVKQYLQLHAPRYIPVGYSAADDLRYRVSLARYLTCGDEDSAVDFYGVNSYQWCGEQTFETAGYDILLSDHAEFTVPIFLSEYGCNLVQPRLFQEVEMLYSQDMTGVFSGGLAYEFTQELNNYGLVTVDVDGDVYLRPDFITLKNQFEKYQPILLEMDEPKKRPNCRRYYDHLGTDIAIPSSIAPDMIRDGIKAHHGKYIENYEFPDLRHTIYDVSGNVMKDTEIKIKANVSAPPPLSNLSISSIKPPENKEERPQITVIANAPSEKVTPIEGNRPMDQIHGKEKSSDRSASNEVTLALTWIFGVAGFIYVFLIMT